MIKDCLGCGESKTLEQFSKQKNGKFGRRSRCKLCVALEYQNNKEAISARQKLYYRKNKDRRLKYHEQWRSDNREYIRKKKAEYFQINKKKIVQQLLEKGRSNSHYQIRHNIDNRLRMAIKTSYNSKSLPKLLGCSIKQLKLHLESQFQPGMNWENYGEWHIDHIKPLSKFDLTIEEQLKTACHFSNLQPLWAIDNLRKGAS